MYPYRWYLTYHWFKAHSWSLISTISGLLCTFTLIYLATQLILSLLNQ